MKVRRSEYVVYGKGGGGIWKEDRGDGWMDGWLVRGGQGLKL